VDGRALLLSRHLGNFSAMMGLPLLIIKRLQYSLQRLILVALEECNSV
jgi:hypothetical protein